MKRVLTPNTRRTNAKNRWKPVGFGIGAALLAAILVAPLLQGGAIGFRSQAVGGVHVDAAGIVRSATVAERQERLAMLRREVQKVDGDLAQKTDLRMISLRRLQDAMAAVLAQPGGELEDEFRYLAGLQRIQYVFVYPEENDIVIGGPAESWTVREDATVVGADSGMPVVMLDDLITALRSVDAARRGGITCSIEPTAEGYQRLNALLRRVRLRPGSNPQAMEPAIREAFGPQQIKLNGVPEESHFARILVAADYQMKRIAMNLDPSGVDHLPGYLGMARNSIRADNANPRWWMACNYDAVERTADRLAWHISGQGVKTMTETEVVSGAGEVSGTGQADPLAQKWADLMTENFDALAARQSVFGQLRNAMDTAVVATLIVQEDLESASGCDLSVLMGREDVVHTVSYDAPRAVEAQASFIRGGNGWVVSASGGVDVNAFSVIANQREQPRVGEIRQKVAGREATSWWWNG